MTTADLLDDLARALLDEERAREEVRQAMARQATALGRLRDLGVPATRVVQRVAATHGMALAVGDRLTIARRLRKRAERETSRRAELRRPHGLTASAAAPSERAIPPELKEHPMPKLVKRTVTEEFIEEKDDDRDDVEEDEPESDDEEAKSPRKSRDSNR